MAPPYAIPPLFLLILVSALLGLAGLCAMALAAWRSRAMALARAAAAEERVGQQARCLSLAAAELRSQGLGMLGHAGAAGVEAAMLSARAEALLQLADDISDSASVSAGPRRIREATVALAPLLDQVLAGLDAQLAPGRRHWRVEPALRGLLLRADSRALSGILTALLQRLARETGEGEAVALRLLPGPESLAIAVEAAGAGLPPGDLAPESIPAGGPGTRGLGLGLSVARSLAQAHGGELALEAAPGIGLRAWLVLPRSRLLPAVVPA
jgi:signal transduction histidine kinase